MRKKGASICIILAILFASVYMAHGQIGIRALYLMPKGDLGFTYQPGATIELSYGKQFSKRATKRFRSSLNLVYKHLKPRLESFPIYAFVSDGNGQRVEPGELKYERFRMAWLAPAYDYAIIHKKNFNAFAGLELLMGACAFDYISDIYAIASYQYQGASAAMVGPRLRLGFEYSLNDSFSLYFLGNKGMIFFWPDIVGFYGVDDIGVGARYIF